MRDLSRWAKIVLLPLGSFGRRRHYGYIWVISQSLGVCLGILTSESDGNDGNGCEGERKMRGGGEALYTQIPVSSLEVFQYLWHGAAKLLFPSRHDQYPQAPPRPRLHVEAIDLNRMRTISPVCKFHRRPLKRRDDRPQLGEMGRGDRWRRCRNTEGIA